MQKVWLEGIDWDNEIPAHLQQQWNNYNLNLLEVHKIRIARCVIQSSPSKIELHGYCDSSELAFASAVYLKCVYPDGSLSVNLLTSRTRVAPVKTVSLPRLELCGAVLLSKTIKAVQKSFEQPHHLFCWTDSTITLSWISAHSRNWKTFVANLVSTIQSLTPPECWRHVRGEDNPADLPSRGIPTQELINSKLWWHGPAWLQQDSYPNSTASCSEEEVVKEERAKLSTFHHSTNSSHDKLFSAFSSVQKLYRCTVYLMRFILFLKSKTVIKSPITTSEMKTARTKLIVWAQAISFSKDINHLKKENKLPGSSKLMSLTTFLDSDGLLRVGGRLQEAIIPEKSRHPLILPHNHQLTTLIISYVHHCHLHSGFTLTHAAVRREFWILRGRDTIRHLIRGCITCRRATAATTQQLMGNLPSGRVTVNRPLLYAGVDCAGPFQTKIKKGRHFVMEKTWFAIFVCFATKAVHLEVVTSLSSEAFIACYERFVSRRGITAHMYSDCGTNFVGADKLLQIYMKEKGSRLQHQFASRGTTWHFNPPSSPHQGGLWEAGVKAVKFHFYRAVGQQVLQLEQFQTLLCKIEACLNSRPLCALSSEPTDLEALTPGHFLIGESLTNIPEPDFTQTKENRLKYWDLIRQKTQHFWRRWAAEYLSSLQQRFKWTEKRKNLHVGDLVVIADNLMPVAKWKLGRITTTHPGADGLVRSGTVKTTVGELKRPLMIM